MPTYKPDPNQQSFLPLQEAAERERFAMLISALRCCEADEKIRSLVLLVYNMQKDGRGALTWTLQEIGDEFQRNRDTARRWVRRAVELGLLTNDERRHRKGGQQTNSLAIDWEGVVSIACSPERTGQPSPERTTEAPPETGVAKSSTGVAKPPHRGGKTTTPYKEYNSSLDSFNNSPPPTPARTSSPWTVVVEEVFAAGVDRATAAVEVARQHGATPEQLRELVAWWQQHRDAFDHPEVVLYRRLQRWSADVAIDEGWPAFRDGYRAPSDAAAERESAYWSQLEDRWRCTVATWPPEHKRAWAEAVLNSHPELAHCDPSERGRAIYRHILVGLERQAQAESQL